VPSCAIVRVLESMHGSVHENVLGVPMSILGVYLGVVLATGPGNPPPVRVLTGGSVRFGSLPGRKPEPRGLGGFITRTGHKPAVFWPGCTRTAGPFHGSSIFLQISLQLSI